MKRVVIAVTGASGQIYAKKIIERLRNTNSDRLPTIQLDVIFTDTAKSVYLDELGEQPPQPLIDNNSYYSPSASGSNPADVMIIIPCTMGTVGRIASGATTDLISRIAEVQLKERKTLIIVPRETPYSLIHLRNLTTLTEAGAIIAPASPSFYMHPASTSQSAASTSQSADTSYQTDNSHPASTSHQKGTSHTAGNSHSADTSNPEATLLSPTASLDQLLDNFVSRILSLAGIEELPDESKWMGK